jgi:hypothetical protein
VKTQSLAAVLLVPLLSSCFVPIDLLQLHEQMKKKEKEKATGRPASLDVFEPAELESRHAAKGAPVTFKLRAYADEEYRAANVRWEQRIRALVGEASDYLADCVGARLEVESVRRWPRRSAKDGTAQLLRELQAADEGNDVDFVVGFVSPLGFVTTIIHEIGMAAVPGKHFVLRGIDDTEDAAALAKYFTDLNATERADFLARRRQHKELVVFLHEWLHNLGALHHSDREMLLHPSYANQQRALDPENAQVVALSLQALVAARGAGAPPDYRRMRAYVASAKAESWYTADREQLLAVLPASAAPAAAAPGPAPAPAAAASAANAPARPADDERARAASTARAALDAKHPEEARAALAPALKRFPEDAGLLALSCELAVNHSRTGKDDGSCERAVAASEDLPAALFWSALARANQGDRQVAVARLLRAKKVDPAFEGSWKVLADLYRLDGRSAELKALRAEYQTRFGQPLR